MRKIAGYAAILSFLLVALVQGHANAHPGPTDANGCHKDNRGRWHCH